VIFSTLSKRGITNHEQNDLSAVLYKSTGREKSCSRKEKDGGLGMGEKEEAEGSKCGRCHGGTLKVHAKKEIYA